MKAKSRLKAMLSKQLRRRKVGAHSLSAGDIAGMKSVLKAPSRSRSGTPNVSGGAALASNYRFKARRDSQVRIVLPRSRKKADPALIKGPALARARNFLKIDAFGCGSKASRDSRVNTYSKMCRLGGESNVPIEPFPVTEKSLEVAAARLKDLSYSTADKILDAARQEHFSRNGTWTVRHIQVFKELLRSCRRGLQKRRKAATFSLHLVARCAPHQRAPVVSGGPLWPTTTLILQVSFACREIETAQLTFSCLSISPMERLVIMSFTSQKNNSEYVQDISLGCMNPQSRHLCALEVPCAVCHGVRHKSASRDLCKAIRPSASEVQLAELPLFPAADNSPCSKEATVASMIALIDCAGIPLVDGAGNHSFSGHSLKRSCLRMLSDGGCSLPEICAVSRRESKAVLDYLDESKGRASETIPALVHKRLASLNPVQLPVALSSSAGSKATPQQFAQHFEAWSFAINTDPRLSRKVHLVLSDQASSTRCGWKFRESPWCELSAIREAADANLCSICLGKTS